MATINLSGEGTAATGKILQGQGVGTANAYSTATYPSTAGSSGNRLQSDGTNFVSTAASAGTFYNGTLSVNGGNPGDTQTYYFIQSSTVTANTSATIFTNRNYVISAFTLNVVYGILLVETTLGSNENSTLFIRVNNSANTNISTTLKWDAASTTFNITNLGLSLSAGDYFVFGVTTPAWGTNPVNTSINLGWSS